MAVVYQRETSKIKSDDDIKAELIVLYRKPKEFAIEIGLSLIVVVVYQIITPYWG